MNETDRQTKFEADALQDGILRYCQTREYALATDSKPVRDLVADALKPLAQAILQEQLALKAPGSQKLPRYATPPPSISHEKLALITLGTLLNTISQSEFDEGVAPALTSVAYEIGSGAGGKESLIAFETGRWISPRNCAHGTEAGMRADGLRMVFSPYYKNGMLGEIQFGAPLPQVTDDASTPFAVVVIPVDD